MKLTTRSKVVARYTTNPADMGYDGRPSNWLTARGEVMGVRRAADFPKELDRRVGQGVFRRTHYSVGGVEVPHHEILLLVGMMDAK